jgi:hypothetical protein
MWFCILYCALFGGRSARRAMGFVILALMFFFYCFVHEAFDSPTSRPVGALPHEPGALNLR